MSKKSFGIRNFFFSFIIVCVAIYLFQSYNNSVDIVVAQKGELEDIIASKGIVVKKEDVFTAKCEGNVTFHCEEGDKLSKGVLVADLNSAGGSEEVKKQINEINATISMKKSKGNEVETEKSEEAILTVDDISLYQENIQQSILGQNFESTYNIMGQVENNTNNSILLTGMYDYYSVKELENLKTELAQSIETNNIPYYSQFSGIVSYKTDGLEEIYKYDNVLEITPSMAGNLEYKETDGRDTLNVQRNDKLFKLIYNFDYYIVATVNNEYAKLFEEGKYIKTRVKSDLGDHIVWGFIEKINYGSEESSLIIYFDDYFYKIYDKRYVDIELITATNSGIKISTDALTLRNGLPGVYIKNASNIIKFFPVEIVGQNEDIAIVSEGDYKSDYDRRTINIFDTEYSTIKIFDKVVTEPDRVYEGQIVD